MTSNDLTELTERLDIVIKILAANFIENAGAPKEQIKKLSSVGMTPAQIGKLMGKPTNHITAYMTQIKKEKK